MRALAEKKKHFHQERLLMLSRDLLQQNVDFPLKKPKEEVIMNLQHQHPHAPTKILQKVRYKAPTSRNMEVTDVQKPFG